MAITGFMLSLDWNTQLLAKGACKSTLNGEHEQWNKKTSLGSQRLQVNQSFRIPMHTLIL